MSNTQRITIAGFGGQGVMLLGQILAHSAIEEDLNSLWFPSYGPETRGGTANCSVTISKNYINSPVYAKADVLMAFNKPSLQKFLPKVREDGIVLYNTSLAEEIDVRGLNVYGIPVNDIAIELGNIKVLNMVMLGAYLELSNLFSDDCIARVLENTLGEAKKHLVDVNIKAIEAGRKYIRSL